MTDRPTLPPDARDRLADAADRFSTAVVRRFDVDLRALAAFRIALGALVIADLASRARDLEAFYTDAGVLPREALYADYADVHSLHALSGETWAQVLLFALAGAVAFALLVGYRTRLATVVSWLLLVSLHVRNPMVLNGGDVLLRMLLFWGVFLPLGERWSVDARRIDRDRTSVASVATMALLLQVVFVYATNATHKLGSERWVNGEAVVYIMGVDQFTILLGNVLVEYHDLLRAFTRLWLALVVLSPLLVVLTGVPRAAFASAFVGMHLGMALSMRIDLFPLICIAALVPFYPAAVWDAVDRTGVADALRRLGDRLPDVGRPPARTPGLPDGSALAGGFASGAAGARILFSTVLPCIFLVCVVFSNAQAVGYTEVPEPAERVVDTASLDQSWRMFAPNPIRTTRWYVAPGVLEDGTEVDALRGTQVDWDRPTNVEQTYPTARWRKYLSNVRSASNRNHRSYLANHLCERWNDGDGPRLETVTVSYAYERYDPYDETEPTTGVELVEYECSGEFVQ